jgi:hypothetical protein
MSAGRLAFSSLEVDQASQLGNYGVGLPNLTRAWAWSRRVWYYLDRTISVTPDGIMFIAAQGGGFWVCEQRPDAYSESLDEFWYDNAAGSNDNTGARGSPIQSVSELAHRAKGGSTDAVLYVAAALSDSESALFDKMSSEGKRDWTIVNGALPVTPKCMYDARSIDGLGNATLIDGQILTTWKNLGSVGALGDVTATGSPTYRAVASAGKLRNAPSVAFPGNAYFRRAITGLSAPITWVTIAKFHDRSVQQTLVDGSDGSNRCTLMAFSSLWYMYAGGLATPLGFTGPTSGTYHYAHASFPSNAGVFAANGTVHDASPPLEVGTQMVAGITIGADATNATPLSGEVVLVFALDGEENKLDATMFNDYMLYHFGSGFPQ